MITDFNLDRLRSENRSPDAGMCCRISERAMRKAEIATEDFITRITGETAEGIIDEYDRGVVFPRAGDD